jgi:hypothetical protein
LALLALLALLAALALPQAAPASSSKKTFQAVTVSHGIAKFRLGELKPAEVSAARVRVGRRSWAVPTGRVRAAARRGWLRVRVASSHRHVRGSVQASGKRKPRLIVVTTPTVAISSGPADPTTATSAGFSFTTTNATTVACRLDAGSYLACASPVTYQGLAPGSHLFTVRATNSAGSLAASWSWNMVAPTPPPPPPPTPTPTGTVALPQAPRSYAVPAGAVSVSTSQQLVSALAGSTARDIVLEDGTYTTTGTTPSSAYFKNGAGHRLWARNLGRAVLQAALVFGGNYSSGGGEAHGLSFDFSDLTKSWDGAAVGSWGVAGTAAKIYDSVFEGHYALSSAIELVQVQGAVVQRVVVRHFRRQGVFVSDCCDANWYDNTAQAQTLTDIDVDGIHEIVPGSADGVAEYGVWIGNGVVNPVERLRIEHAWWSGLWTGSSSHDTIFRDITIATVDRPNGNAIYNEHETVRDTFERFQLGPNIEDGFSCEWNYGAGAGACQNNVFQDGTIDSYKVGVYLDEGQVGNIVRRVKFLNQRCAAIVDRLGSGNSYSDNDYSGIAVGARALEGGC